jgi:Sulfotransferase family
MRPVDGEMATVNGSTPVEFDHIVFLHIQKTAGTSLVEFLRRELGEQAISHGDFLKYEPEQLAAFRFISGHFGYPYCRAIPGRNFTFTFLREPVDRVISLYHFLQTRDPAQFEMYALAQRMSFAEFVQSTHPVVTAHIENMQVWQLASHWGIPAREQWCGTMGELFDEALAHLEALSFFGFRESFEADVRSLVRRLGLTPPSEPLPNSNRTPSRPQATDLSPEVLQTIRNRTDLDRQLYERAWALARGRFADPDTPVGAGT